MSDSEIDYEHLKYYIGEDPTLTRELFGLFMEQVEMWSRGLTPDAEDDVWAATTHSLKGSALAVGAMKLAERCKKAEGLTGDGRRLGAREVAVEQIEQAIDRVRLEIMRWEHAQNLKDLRQA